MKRFLFNIFKSLSLLFGLALIGIYIVVYRAAQDHCWKRPWPQPYNYFVIYADDCDLGFGWEEATEHSIPPACEQRSFDLGIGSYHWERIMYTGSSWRGSAAVETAGNGH